MTPATQVSDLYNILPYFAEHYNLAVVGHFFTAVVSTTVHVLQVVSVLVTLILIGLAIIVTRKMRSLNNPMTPEIKKEDIPNPMPVPAPSGPLASRWQSILKALESNTDNDWKFAILEADTLVDLVLKEKGFSGDGLGERLMNMNSGELANLDGLWEAHKIRNRIAHDLGYTIRHSEAKRAIELFELVLHELEVI